MNEQADREAFEALFGSEPSYMDAGGGYGLRDQWINREQGWRAALAYAAQQRAKEEPVAWKRRYRGRFGQSDREAFEAVWNHKKHADPSDSDYYRLHGIAVEFWQAALAYAAQRRAMTGQQTFTCGFCGEQCLRDQPSQAILPITGQRTEQEPVAWQPTGRHYPDGTSIYAAPVLDDEGMELLRVAREWICDDHPDTVAIDTYLAKHTTEQS